MLKRLPEEVRVDLTDAHGLPGCSALLRPMDVEDKARFLDDLQTGREWREASARLVKRSLIALDGVEVEGAKKDDKPSRFDPTNRRHWTLIDVNAVLYLAGELLAPTELTEEQEKNSDSPSDSGGTSSGAS